MVRSTIIAMPRLIFAYILISFPLIAQEAGNYSISGVVVNSQTGEPVKYALVTLMSFPVFDPNHPPQQPVKPQGPTQKTAQAGETGEFVFHGLAKAHYTLSAQKPGFAAGFIGRDFQPNQIDLTDNVTGAQVRLSPPGVIEGKVVDQDDEPLLGVQILALQVQVNDGVRDTSAPRSVATDDRGIYRIANLQPGRYYIKAAGKSGGTYRYVGDTNPYYSSWQSFAPVYPGDARTLDSATPVTIDPGTNAAADFHLRLEPAFRIRGTIQNAPSGAVTFELVQGAERVAASRSSLNASTGRFEVQDVTPGAYLLRVEEAGKLRGEVPVMVSDADVNDVTVSLSPPVTVKGATRVIGAPITMKQMPAFSRAQSMIGQGGMTAEQLEQYGNQPIDANCSVSLNQAGASASSQLRMARGNVQTEQEKGTFTIGDVFPGVYGVHAQCYGGYATAILAGGMDLLTTPLLSIQPGVALPPIEVQVKTGGGTLTGALPAGAPLNTVGILTVPAFNSTGPQISPAANGFTIQFLAPGDYTVYAFADWQKVEYRNPSFLQTLAGGVSVHIEDGKEQHISLTPVIK
jgi:hypothetical protein